MSFGGVGLFQKEQHQKAEQNQRLDGKIGKATHNNRNKSNDEHNSQSINFQQTNFKCL